MRKILLSVLVIVSFIFYTWFQRNKAAETVNTPVKTANSATNPKVSQISYKNGEYIGGVVDAYYGFVQVKVIIRNNQLSDVQFLKFPSERQTSVEINSVAVPNLRTEAIQAQSYQVDIVTGATQTSKAFRASLQSALVQAI